MRRLSILGGAMVAAVLLGLATWIRRIGGDAGAPEPEGGASTEPGVERAEHWNPTRWHSRLPEDDTDPSDPGDFWVGIERMRSPAEFLGALKDLAGRTDSESLDMQQLLVRKWGELDPVGAAEWAGQLEPGPLRSAALRQVSIAWANKDLEGAVQWVRTMPEGVEKSRATLDIGYEAARTAPVTSLELGVTLPPSKERDDLLIHAVSQWSESDPSGAQSWVQEVPDTSLRDRLIGAVAVAVAELDGSAAATLVSSGLNPGEEQDRAAVSVVQRWAAEDPPAVAEWVRRFPESDIQEAALKSLVAIWLERDLEAVGNWVQTLPEGALRDLGVRMYESGLAESEDDVILPPPEPKPSYPETSPTRP